MAEPHLDIDPGGMDAHWWKGTTCINLKNYHGNPCNIAGSRSLHLGLPTAKHGTCVAFLFSNANKALKITSLET